MENHSGKPAKIDGKIIAQLLDQHEYPSNLGNVAAISDQQICFLRRDRHELVNFRLEYFDMRDCRAIECQKKTVYYRIIVGAALFIAAAFLAFMLVMDPETMRAQNAPVIIMVIALVTVGIRFITSTHRHVVRFEMPVQALSGDRPQSISSQRQMLRMPSVIMPGAAGFFGKSSSNGSIGAGQKPPLKLSGERLFYARKRT